MKKLIHILLFLPLLMFGQQTESPSSNTSTSCGGTAPWMGRANTYFSDNAYSTITIEAGEGFSVTSYCVNLTNFSFSIPTGATIVGIVVGVEKKMATSDGTIYDYVIKLIKGGTIDGNNKANASLWPSSDTYVNYGNSSDTWGLALNNEDINASDFGISIQVTITDNTSEDQTIAYIDHVEISVYYSQNSAETPSNSFFWHNF